MIRHLSLLFFLPLFISGQTYTPSKTVLSNAYAQAIADFIKAANKKNNSVFDTLYFGKRANGQPDDFPDIVLPKTIENTQIREITPKEGERSQKEKKSRIYINLMGWVSKEESEFLFVVFSKGFEHQHDYTIIYKYNARRKAFELEKLKFKGPPFDK